ncbi:cytokine receptor-like factor 2 isoform X2 [Pseudophryne corroboree]
MSNYCFQMVLQWKSSNDMGWKITMPSSKCSSVKALFYCSFYDQNLYPENCFQIQLKFQTLKVCAPHESEWSQTIFTKNGSVLDSCAEVTSPTPIEGVNDSFLQRYLFIIIFSTISCVVFFVILSLGCAMDRVKKCIFPAIPDPKNVFSELYDSHSGYLQDWIKTSENEIQQEEIGWTMDERHEEQMPICVKENEPVMPENQLDNAKHEEIVTASASTEENVPDLCFGNINITTNESMYIVL